MHFSVKNSSCYATNPPLSNTQCHLYLLVNIFASKKVISTICRCQIQKKVSIFQVHGYFFDLTLQNDDVVYELKCHACSHFLHPELPVSWQCTGPVFLNHILKRLLYCHATQIFPSSLMRVHKVQLQYYYSMDGGEIVFHKRICRTKIWGVRIFFFLMMEHVWVFDLQSILYVEKVSHYAQIFGSCGMFAHVGFFSLSNRIIEMPSNTYKSHVFSAIYHKQFLCINNHSSRVEMCSNFCWLEYSDV